MTYPEWVAFFLSVICLSYLLRLFGQATFRFLSDLWLKPDEVKEELEDEETVEDSFSEEETEELQRS